MPTCLQVPVHLLYIFTSSKCWPADLPTPSPIDLLHFYTSKVPTCLHAYMPTPACLPICLPTCRDFFGILISMRLTLNSLVGDWKKRLKTWLDLYKIHITLLSSQGGDCQWCGVNTTEYYFVTGPVDPSPPLQSSDGGLVLHCVIQRLSHIM